MPPFDADDELATKQEKKSQPTKLSKPQYGINRFVLFSHEPHQEVGDKPKGQLSGKIIYTHPSPSASE